MKKRVLIQRQLVLLGLLPNEERAKAYLMAGDVYVNGQRARAGQWVGPRDRIEVPALKSPFIAKGGIKLSAALAAFSLSPKGLVCLDAGASTGGFTDCLIRRGAALVYAVDIGFGQLHGSLRQNDRVVNLERTNLSDPKLRSLSPRPTLSSCDLSYLSLLKAVPLYRAIQGGEGRLITLVKPLFETEDMQTRRTGQMAQGDYAPLLRRLIDGLNEEPGTRVLSLCHSPVTGNGGTLEFFFHLAFEEGPAPDLGRAVAKSVEAALSLTPYRKGDLCSNEIKPAAPSA